MVGGLSDRGPERGGKSRSLTTIRKKRDWVRDDNHRIPKLLEAFPEEVVGGVFAG